MNPIQNSLQYGDALLLLNLNYVLEYTIRMNEKYQKGLTMDGMHKIVVYVLILIYLGGGGNYNKNAEAVLNTKVVDLDINTTYLFSMKISNGFLEMWQS
jgi:hypothetical protein